MIMPKLKLCCVAREAFSPADSSFHGTNPSSLKAVTLRRRGPGAGAAPRLFCVAYNRAGEEAGRGRNAGRRGRKALAAVLTFILEKCRWPSYQDLSS